MYNLRTQEYEFIVSPRSETTALSPLQPRKYSSDRVGVYMGETKNGMAYGEGIWIYKD